MMAVHRSDDKSCVCPSEQLLDVDFFATQEPHLRVPKDRLVCVGCFSKYGYRLDAPLH